MDPRTAQGTGSAGRSALGRRVAKLRRWLDHAAPLPVSLAALALFLCTLCGTAVLAALHGIDRAERRAADLAAGVLESVQTISEQIDTGLALSLQAMADPACGPEHIAYMLTVQARYGYIAGIAHLEEEGERVMCSTLGPQAQALRFAERDMVRIGTRRVYRRVALPAAEDVEYFAVADRRAMVFVHSKVALTILSTLRDAALGAYLRPDGPVVFQRGDFDLAAIMEMERSGSTGRFDGRRLLGVARSTRNDYAAFVSFPPDRAWTNIRDSEALLLPVGTLLGLALSILLFVVLRNFTSMAASLRRAMAANRLYMEYQPIFELASGRCVGAEALVRWRRAKRPVPPDRFIAAAERAGIMHLVTRRVVELVTRDLADFLRRHPSFHVSINFSALDLRAGHAEELLSGLISVTGLEPRSFWVEITETGLVEEIVSSAVDRIRAMGICVAVDDFGTGYSHLEVLQTLQVDLLKIDKRFVQTISEEGRASEVAMAIIGLARSLSLEMVAEGIETQVQADFLIRNGVEFGQGWLFARPGSVAVLEALMAQGGAGRSPSPRPGRPAR